MSNEVLDRLRAERDQCRDTALALMEADDYDPGSEALKHLEERGVSLDGQIERIIKTAERQQSSDALDGPASRGVRRSSAPTSSPPTAAAANPPCSTSTPTPYKAGRCPPVSQT
jgi:hypothetical protein